MELKLAILQFGASSKKIEMELKDAGIAVPCVRTESMKDAVDIARSFATPGLLFTNLVTNVSFAR
jgi:hypothetical protein